MARDSIAVQKLGSDLTLAGITFTAMVAADDVEVTGCDEYTIFLFQNAGSTGAQVATIVSVDDIYGRPGDITVTVAQGATGAGGRMRPDNFHQLGTHTVHVDTADEDAFSIAAISADFIL